MSVQLDGDGKTKVTDLRFEGADATVVGTPASATGVYPVGQGVVRHMVHKVKVTYSALTAAALTQDITLLTTPAKTRVVRIIADVTTKFIGGSISAMTLVAGRTAGGNQYLLSGDVFTAAILLGDVVAEMGAGVVSATLADYQAAAQTIQCRFTATTANVNTATQGEVDFYIETVTYP